MYALLLFACVDPPPPTPPPRPTLTVVRGDTLGALAKRHGVSVRQLKAWNGLKDDRIEVGQVLELHADGSVPSPPTAQPRPGGTAAPRPVEAPSGTADGPRPPALRRPPPKVCLKGPTSVDGDHGMAASTGLSHEQAARAMNALVGEVDSCLVGLDHAPPRPLGLSVTVGCDGRVTSARIEDPGGWPSAHAECLRQSVPFADFPAHALPDGDTFLYGLNIEW